jgi:HD domain
VDTRLVASSSRAGSFAVAGRSGLVPAEWITDSQRLSDAYSLAEAAHGSQRRASDGRYFLEHVVEVGETLHRAGFDDELVAVGLLHDTVERGTLNGEELQWAMGSSIASLVLTLSENPNIESFDSRKAGLRRQVEGGGGLAVTVFAADKLSDIRGLHRGMEIYGDALPRRLGTSVASMAAHYRESVEMIESAMPDSAFLPVLRVELKRLGAAVPRQSIP